MDDRPKPEMVRKVSEQLAQVKLPPANSTADEMLKKYGKKFELDAICAAIRSNK